ncbi:MAG: hypothetical protein M0Z53_03680 [Thermaerobacter sp.]|nr:hypothetical protein [Thermaerobacter sp.]
MIKVRSVNWVRGAWDFRFAIHEGVYDFDNYPARVSHLAFSGEVYLREAVVAVVTELLRRHLRSGSIPPHGMVLDWIRAPGMCVDDPPEMTAACRTIEASNLPAGDSAVSCHF